ncbi:MAG: R3H domain-containing nucleic acid-binding protein [Candidatus Shapirobacteria bacterium]|jgi:spoIIIJ-associated protein
MNNKDRNEVILNLTCELLAKMNIDVEKAAAEDVVGEDSEEGQVLVEVTVTNPAGLIGFRGRNLSAVQFILALMVKNKIGEWVRILMDVNNYRSEQKSRLEKMTIGLAEKVVKTGKPLAMANMSSFERRLCHMVIGGIEGIVSESEGEGEERHIVIKPKA